VATVQYSIHHITATNSNNKGSEEECDMLSGIEWQNYQCTQKLTKLRGRESGGKEN